MPTTRHIAVIAAASALAAMVGWATVLDGMPPRQATLLGICLAAGTAYVMMMDHVLPLGESKLAMIERGVRRGGRWACGRLHDGSGWRLRVLVALAAIIVVQLVCEAMVGLNTR